MHKKQKILLLLALSLLGILLYVGLGLTEKNLGYFLPLRLKKIAAILIVSYCVGYSAVTFQTITGNKILTPSIIGLDSLYLFVQTVIVFFFQSKQLVAMEGVWNFFLSLVIMVGFSLVLYTIMFRGDKRNMYFLVLSGIIVGNLFGGMSTFMQVLLDPNEFNVLQGSMFASFSNMKVSLLGVGFLVCLVCFLITFRDLKELDVLALGTDTAINLGVSYKKIVRKNLIVVALLISVSTVLVGPITFLSILLVSLARKLMGTYRHSYLSITAILLGIIALSYGLFLVERVFDMKTTLSVIINFVGGLYFIYFLIKEGKR